MRRLATFILWTFVAATLIVSFVTLAHLSIDATSSAATLPVR